VKVYIIMQWENCKQAFHVDGSLRDIYVRETEIVDWEQFLLFIKKSQYKFRYSFSGAPTTIPKYALDIFKNRSSVHNLSIEIEGLEIEDV